MSIKTLMEKLKNRAAVTPVTSRKMPDVTTKPACSLACTPVTAVTSPFDDAGQTVAVLAVTAVAENPDALFWPESPGMATPETERLTERTMLFIRRGLATVEAEQLAFKLIDRDREMDDRRLCLECSNLSRAGGWKCSNWRQADIGSLQVPTELVHLLQRCHGFTNAIQLKKETP